jgi:hypothetical protein
MLRHPGSESTLLAAKAETTSTSTAKPIPDSIPELLRDIFQELWRGLLPSTKRTEHKVANCALRDERS